MATGAPTTRVQRFGGFEVDPRARELRRKGVRIRMQDQPLEVLLLLLDRKGEVVTREELKLQLWPAGTFVDSDDGLNTAVRKLREILGDSAERPLFVETIPRRGYRFIGTLEDELSPVESPHPPEAAEPGSASTVPTVAAATKTRARWPWVAVAIALLCLAAYFSWTSFRTRRAARLDPAPISSLAVLPLLNLSGDPAQEYFADGMTDELITELARIPSLRVVSRTSVMQDKGTHKPLAQIAHELNVDAIVEGSVARSGDHVRIIAQLIDARNDKHLWAQSFDGPLGDVLSLQNSVAREISLQTRAVLNPVDFKTSIRIDPEAHDAYLRGLYFTQRRDGNLAANYFRRAIALEPAYSAAHAGLAEALVTQFLTRKARTADVKPPALAAAKRAIELDPSSGEAYTALGAVDQTFLRDWASAEQNLRRGIELSPSNSHAHIWFAIYLTQMNRTTEAVDAMQRAVALDPLSFWANRHLGATLYFARRYDDSLAALKRAAEIAPDRSPGFVEGWNSLDYEAEGRYAEAVAADLRNLASHLPPRQLDSLRADFQVGGWKAYQEAKIRILLPQATSAGDYWEVLAMSYIRIGNWKQAFHWLNRQADDQSSDMLFLPSDPRLDPIRHDPRFTALLASMHLPH